MQADVERLFNSLPVGTLVWTDEKLPIDPSQIIIQNDAHFAYYECRRSRVLSQYLRKSNPNRVFLFVHSAFYGAWCWHKMVPLLQSKGHIVFTPDLPGHGKNIGISFENIRLSTYVNSLTDQIQDIYKKFGQKIILVGHGAAGAAISQVAEIIPHNIDRLVFLSGFVLKHGESLMQEKQNMINPSVLQETFIDKDKAQIILPLSPRVIQLFFQHCTPEDLLFALSRMQKQPLYPLMDPLTLSDDRFGRIPKTYILCTQNNAISAEDQSRMCKKIEFDRIIKLYADHSSFLSTPERLTKLLDECCNLNRENTVKALQKNVHRRM